MNLRVFIKNLGCPKNEVDGGIMAAYLQRSGCVLVSSPYHADVLILNTCGFIEEAKQESIDGIFELVKIKNSGNRKKLIVAGCLSQRYRDELAAGIPEIDQFLGIGDLQKVVTAVGSAKGQSCFSNHVGRTYQRHDILPLQERRTYAYLKISDGCDNMCTYCAIPLIRGRFRSRPMKDIIREAKQYIENGFREIVLIGQDCAMYGTDIYKGSRLPQLLESIAELPGRYIIRVMYAHPANFTDEMIEAVASHDKIVKYLDLPLQHVSGRILKAMNRKVTPVQIRRLVEKLRVAIPGICLRTTYLLGFPDETRRDFEKVLHFQQEYDIERVGVFGYSPEEGTAAFSRSHRIRPSTIAGRIDELMSLVQEQSLSRNQSLVGSSQSLLVDGPAGDGRFWARLLSQAPEIDGCVLLKGRSRRGSFVSAGITSAEAYDLYADLLS